LLGCSKSDLYTSKCLPKFITKFAINILKLWAIANHHKISFFALII